MDSNVTISNYTEIDRILREEKIIIANQVKKIAKTGCNLLIVQKSILRDDLSPLAIDYLGKAKISIIRNVEREEINKLAQVSKFNL